MLANISVNITRWYRKVNMLAEAAFLPIMTAM